MFCNNCGKPIDDNTTFCGECGAKVEIDNESGETQSLNVTPEKNLCKKCHAPLDNNATFCGECGTPVNSSEVEYDNIPVKPAWQEPIPYQTEPPKELKKKENLKPLIIALATVVVLSAGVIYYFLFWNNSTVDVAVPNASGSPQESVTPSASPTSSPEVKIQNNLVDMQKVSEFIASDANHASFSVSIKDLKNNVFYSTNNAETRMSASALVNIPIMYIASKEIDKGNNTLDSNIKFNYRYSGRGNLKQNQNGEYFPLSYLLNQMLNYSDNNATNSLMDYYGLGKVNTICRENGFNSVDLQRYLGETSNTKDNYVSAKDITTMLSNLYQFQTALSKSYILNNFKIVDESRNQGAGKFLPSNITFLNHNAVTSEIYNETAIVISDKAEFVITVLSNNGKSDTSSKTVADITDYVYTCLNR